MLLRNNSGMQVSENRMPVIPPLPEFPPLFKSSTRREETDDS